MMLKITELGLGSVWVGWFNPELVKEILKLPDEYEVSAILPFGYIQRVRLLYDVFLLPLSPY
jgi:nitroreductase